MSQMPEPDESPDRLLIALSPRSRKQLTSLGFTTDQAVRDRVEEHGALSLLRSRNMYRRSYLEICETFGFDPKGEAPETVVPTREDLQHGEADSDPGPGF